MGKEGMPCRLAELIHENGRRRDQDMRENAVVNPRLGDGDSTRSEGFGAAPILREEDGFELWLGSLDDALCVAGLQSRGISAILNCASEDCERECAMYRVCRGRRRCHARDRSMGNCIQCPEATSPEGFYSLDRDQVRSLALFDGEWYSEVMQREVAYCAIGANDETGYRMDAHYAEASAFLERCRGEGRKVLVHCVMGVNRSSAAVVAFLSGSLGMKLTEAIDLASSSRGHILSNASFLDQLVERFASEEAEPNRESNKNDCVEGSFGTKQISGETDCSACPCPAGVDAPRRRGRSRRSAYWSPAVLSR